MSVSQVVAALEGAGVAVGPVMPADGAVQGVKVAGVQQDSRRVAPGDLFVAWCGAVHDAHDYVAGAAAAGAAAAIVERPVPGAPLPQIQVDNARLAAAVASGFVAGSPWRDLDVVGVTGTNGKTTTALLLRGLLAHRAPTAAIGTLGVTGPDGRVQEGTEGLTTPGPVQLSGWLSSLVRAGVSRVVLESSSHALDQFRLDGLRFDVAAFTNLTRDHLDYHGTLESYLAAKARPCCELRQGGVHRGDQTRRPRMERGRPRGPVITYGLGPASARASDLRMSVRGSYFDLEWTVAAYGGAAAAGASTSPTRSARRRVRWALRAARSKMSPAGWARRLRSRGGWRSWCGSLPGADRFRPYADASRRCCRHATLRVRRSHSGSSARAGTGIPSTRPPWVPPSRVTGTCRRHLGQPAPGPAAYVRTVPRASRWRLVEIVGRRGGHPSRALDAAAPGAHVAARREGGRDLPGRGHRKRPFDERRIVLDHLATRGAG